MCSRKKNCTASLQIPTFICLWAIYIFPDRSTYLAAAKETDRSWKYINLSQICECRNWETEHYNSAAQFHFWEYINGNQTFILDSHWPFICSAIFTSIFRAFWKMFTRGSIGYYYNLADYDKCSDYVLDLCTLFPGDIITKVQYSKEKSCNLDLCWI
jgi:hypothetical protein